MISLLQTSFGRSTKEGELLMSSDLGSCYDMLSQLIYV